MSSSVSPSPRPSVIVFDVNETLSDLSPLAARFVAVGAAASASQAWFASVLRDGFALSLAGHRPVFAELAREALAAHLSVTTLRRPLDEAVAHVLEGLPQLPVHQDVVEGVNALADAGIRLVTLSNGSPSIAEGLLEEAGVRDRFEHVLSVEGNSPWKPHPDAYAYAAGVCAVGPGEMMLVATHPWDVDGANRAGLQSAWVNRSESHYPQTFTAPTCTVGGLDELADVLEDATS